MVDQDSIGPLQSTWSDFIRNLLKAWHVPGVSIAVIGGEQSWTEVRTQRTDKN